MTKRYTNLLQHQKCFYYVGNIKFASQISLKYH